LKPTMSGYRSTSHGRNMSHAGRLPNTTGPTPAGKPAYGLHHAPRKDKTMQVFQRTLQEGQFHNIPCGVPFASTSLERMRHALTLWACTIYGQKGRDWTLVADSTVIGFHIRAVGLCDGETLALR
jgi:hypothetical protein